MDTFVHLWDLRLAGGESSITEGDRKGMRPAVSLCAWTGTGISILLVSICYNNERML